MLGLARRDFWGCHGKSGGSRKSATPRPEIFNGFSALYALVSGASAAAPLHPVFGVARSLKARTHCASGDVLGCARDALDREHEHQQVAQQEPRQQDHAEKTIDRREIATCVRGTRLDQSAHAMRFRRIGSHRERCSQTRTRASPRRTSSCTTWGGIGRGELRN